MSQLTNYSVFWLDNKQNDPLNDYRIDRSRLRGIIDYLRFFSQVETCVENIRNINDQQIFIIVTSSCSLLLLNQIQNLSHVRSTYTYQENTDDEPVRNASNSHGLPISKQVTTIFKHPNELLAQFSQDIRVLLRQSMGMDSMIPFSILSSNEERTTESHSRTNIHWFPYLMEALQEIPPVINGKEKFVVECQKLYQDNESTLKFVKEFNDTYESQKAVAWYTREGILYQLFNRVLRQLDQHKIFLLHFFIYDLSQQLKKEADNSKDANWREEPMYRGQRISKKEVEFLKQQKTLYVSTFLSTTKNLMLAEIYAGVGSHTYDRDSEEQSVIFKIGSSAIDHLSHFGGAEDEILFAPTYTFFPMSVKYDENTAVWNVTLLQFIETYDLRYEYLNYLIRLDVCLRTIIADDVTENVFSANDNYTVLINHIVSLMHELVIEDDDIVTLSSISDRSTNNNVSKLELKGIALFTASVPPRVKSTIPSLTIPMLYDCITTLYKCMGRYELALENYTRAQNYANDQNPTHTIMRKVKIAQIHKIMGNPSLAWKTFEEILPETIIDDELFYRIFTDVAMNKPLWKNVENEHENNQNVHQYLKDYSLKSLRFLINHVPDDFTLSDEELDGCWEWILSLFKMKSDKDGSHMPTKQELYNMCKPSNEHPSLKQEQIVKMLQETMKQLQQQLPSTRKRYQRKRLKIRLNLINYHFHMESAIAVIGSDEIGLKRTTEPVTIPNNDVAYLMYYLNCVCCVIDCKNDPDLQRYISYKNYQLLSTDEQRALFALCRTINPTVLKDKVFFQLDAMCVQFNNEFYDISLVHNRVVAAESILIAGRIRRVTKIMCYKNTWLQTFYYNPMRRLAARFNNSSSPSTYTPITYTQPVAVKDNSSNKCKYIACGICCFVICVLPTIVGIIIDYWRKVWFNYYIGENSNSLSENKLFYPSAMQFDSNENLYVVDLFHNRVQKFTINCSPAILSTSATSTTTTSTQPPHHLIGIGLLFSLFLPTNIIGILSLVFLIYPLIKQILRYYNYLPTSYAKDIILFLIGIRPNGANPFTKSFGDIGRAFRNLYVGANERKSATMYVQYWRSYEALQRWTHTKMGIHVKAVMEYMKKDRFEGENGIWHETYKVRDGEYEAIYGNMPPIGLGLVTQIFPETKTNNGPGRMKQREIE
ncbi:hypothetical protein I4U23_016701 [Adineta vaga]|nr:hypothetical protein I4U23_016701 [Adineta vaga]